MDGEPEYIDAPNQATAFQFHGLSRPLPKSNSGPSVPHTAPPLGRQIIIQRAKPEILTPICPISTPLTPPAGALDSMKYSTALLLRLSVRSIRVVQKWKKAARQATWNSRPPEKKEAIAVKFVSQFH